MPDSNIPRQPNLTHPAEFPFLDLPPNVNLRTLTLHGAIIHTDAESWLGALLESITSPRLERVVFKDVRILWLPGTQRLMRTLDHLFSSKERFDKLVAVDFYPASELDDGRGPRNFNRLAALWMPRLYGRGVLYFEGSRFVPPDETML